MKVHSLTILHYGKDYLSYALQSVYDQVGQCHIFYTPTPSHGHSTNTPPIESKDELRAAAYAYNPGGKVKWYDVENVRLEGQHRDLALQTVIGAGADIVLVVDYDEVWPAQVLENSLRAVINHGTARNNLVNMIHFWRSFNWACYDQGWPVRIIDTRHTNGTNYLDRGAVYHFGYATTDKTMRYKWLIHGHKNEMRPGWLDNIWTKWPPVDIEALAFSVKDNVFIEGVFMGDTWYRKRQYKDILNYNKIDVSAHPTSDNNFWMPVPFDKGQLPEFMRTHPFYDLETIR